MGAAGDGTRAARRHRARRERHRHPGGGARVRASGALRRSRFGRVVGERRTRRRCHQRRRRAAAGRRPRLRVLLRRSPRHRRPPRRLHPAGVVQRPVGDRPDLARTRPRRPRLRRAVHRGHEHTAGTSRPGAGRGRPDCLAHPRRCHRHRGHRWLWTGRAPGGVDGGRRSRHHPDTQRAGRPTSTGSAACRTTSPSSM